METEMQYLGKRFDLLELEDPQKKKDETRSKLRN
jgi:hypothetical protein